MRFKHLNIWRLGLLGNNYKLEGCCLLNEIQAFKMYNV